jgi:hypothetical protein
MPLVCKKNGGKLVTVNLQKTKHVCKPMHPLDCLQLFQERKADLVVNGKLDDVFKKVMANLGIQVRAGEVMAGQGFNIVRESQKPLEIHLEGPKERRKRKRAAN